MKMPAASPTRLLEGLAARVTRRDQPPPSTHDPNDPTQVAQQVLAALVPVVASRGQLYALSRARMLLQFIDHETRTSAELARAAGVGRVAGCTALVSLERAGLLEHRRDGPRHIYRLTRWGEDWLLAVARGEAAPARPAIGTNAAITTTQ